MDIQFAEPFKSAMQGFGIRTSHIEEAIKNADRIESIKIHGKPPIQIFTKLIELPRKKYTLLIIAIKTATTMIVRSAFKVPLQVTQDLSPLTTAEHFANEYGFFMTVNGVRSKFILNRRIPFRSGQTLNQLFGVECGSSDFTASVELSPNDDGETAECAIGFCLDTTKYIENLRVRGLL